jgi:hypothetical protein
MKHLLLFYVCVCTLFPAKCFSVEGGEEPHLPWNRFFFTIDYRNSFITSSDAHVIGFRSGVELNNKFRFGIGYHYLSTEIIETIAFDQAITNAQVRLRYGSISGEYVLLNGPLWQLSAPVLLGFGESAYIPPARFGTKGKKFTIFIEPAITFQYNIIPFIGIGTGIGYRFMPAGDSNLRPLFETPVYDVRIRILLNDVMEVIFPNGVWKKKTETEDRSGQ